MFHRKGILLSYKLFSFFVYNNIITMINWTSNMTSMLSFLLLLQLGSFVVVNGYTLDDPDAVSLNQLNEDVSQDDVMGYLDYLQELREANLPSEGGVQK